MLKFKIGESSVIKDRAKSIHTSVDGSTMQRCVSLPHETGFSVTGVRTSDNTLRTFMFADIRTTGGIILHFGPFCWV